MSTSASEDTLTGFLTQASSPEHSPDILQAIATSNRDRGRGSTSMETTSPEHKEDIPHTITISSPDHKGDHNILRKILDVIAASQDELMESLG